MELPTFIKASPTSLKILEIYPVGSFVNCEDIENAYILLSKSTRRKKRFGKGRHSMYRSIPVSRKLRGRNLYKKMIKLDLWK